MKTKKNWKQEGQDISNTLFDAVYETNTLLEIVEELRETTTGLETLKQYEDVLQGFIQEKRELAIDLALAMVLHFDEKPTQKSKTTAIAKAA